MNRNPIPIVLPCHRIVGASGSLVGYGGGLERKEKLLRLEGATLARSSPRSGDPQGRIPAAADPAFGGQIPEAAYFVAENATACRAMQAADSPRPTG